jgi:DNA-binding NarL/FixJ family response regulator
MLLVEPADVLRRTVALTARSLGMEAVDEAATVQQAGRLLRERRYAGAIIAIDSDGQLDVSLLEQVRQGRSASGAAMPIAVLAAQADPGFVEALRGLDVRRVILKPFRARVLLETFAAMGAGAPPPASPFAPRD